ncbi:9675_t:CDS:2, partial [Funneliformis geosporum]
MKHWHILGVSNSGSFIAHYLRKRGHKVTLLMRDPTTLNKFDKLNRSIEVSKEFEPKVEISKEYQSECIHGYDYGNVIDPRYPNESCPPHLRIRRLIVTIKSHEFSKYYQRIYHRLSPTSTIILFTYGMGTYEELMKDYYNFDEAIRPNLLIGLNSHHVYKRASYGTQFKLIHSGFGEIDLGVIPRRFNKTEQKKVDASLQPEEPLVNVDDTNKDLNNVSFKDTLDSVIKEFIEIPELNARNVNYSNIVNRKLENLALNSVIDPITSIYYIRNGSLLFNAMADRVIRPICAESSMVIRKHRESLGMTPTNRFATDRLIDAVFQICLKTPHFESLSLQYIKKNMPTEIDYLNGYIVKLGNAHNIPTPINQFLIDM